MHGELGKSIGRFHFLGGDQELFFIEKTKPSHSRLVQLQRNSVKQVLAEVSMIDIKYKKIIKRGP